MYLLQNRLYNWWIWATSIPIFSSSSYIYVWALHRATRNPMSDEPFRKRPFVQKPYLVVVKLAEINQQWDATAGIWAIYIQSLRCGNTSAGYSHSIANWDVEHNHMQWSNSFLVTIISTTIYTLKAECRIQR